MLRSVCLLLLCMMVGACDSASGGGDGRPPPSATADSLTGYLQHALDIIEVNSLRIDSIEWGSIREQALESARGAESIEQIHGVITWLLPQLGDDHSFFMPPRAATAWREQPAAVPKGEEGLSGTLAEGRVAYLSIPGFGTGEKESARAFSEEAQALIQSLDQTGACGWILDLRRNGGGNMWPMLAGLGPLLGEGLAGYFIDARGERVAWGIRDGSAMLDEQPQLELSSSYTLEVSAPPVAVLIGPRTASSGEAIAVAFRSRPRTRSFGTATAGLSTSNSTFELADGAVLVLTTAVFADRTGAMYNGPIPPDVSLGSPEADPVPAALEWLHRQDACR